jgi:predicted secreted hydrolase
MAHLGLSDIADEQFYSFDRFSRGGPGLAGAIGDPFIVFLEDWSAVGTGPESMTMRLRAAEGPIAIDLTLESTRAPVLQGNQGLSQKGEEQGNASYYYSLTRMATSGNIRIAGDTFAVDGLSWMDHEFGTSALEEGAIGWDWFSLQLDSGHDLMLYRIRHTNPQKSVFFGVLVAPDGSTQRLAPADVRIEALATWQSPRSGAVYPARWQLAVPPAGLVLEVVPLLADQEMATAVVYWEGAVQVSGTRQGQPVQGHGYVELTGYADAGETVLAD